MGISKEFTLDSEKYPFLYEYSNVVKKPTREILGRDDEIDIILSTFERPELSNVILLGDAGSGKTSIVQGVSDLDSKRLYLEVDLSKMVFNLKNENEMAVRLKELFYEAGKLSSEEIEVVLFIDEFHQIVALSKAAVEALKPLLADSATRGIKVIAATTYAEFRDYISSNQPLVERFTRINIKEPDKKTVIQILKSMAKRYGVISHFYNDYIFEAIYDYTNRYVPANSQPRKSILVLDSMIGFYNFSNGRKRLDMKLLAEVLYRTEGVDVDFTVDPNSLKERLDKRVLSQEFATSVIADRLHLCLAGLNDVDKPMASMLFTGSTGVGKSQIAKELASMLFKDRFALLTFDMTEFANSNSLDRFKDELTSRVWARPNSIILLDEIEKACSEVTRVLLSVLDDGRLHDRNGREISFTNTYIILTTNAGSEIYKTLGEYQEDEDKYKLIDEYDSLIRRSISKGTGDNRFPPELLGRIDKIVPFLPLSEDTMKKIVIMKLDEIQNVIKKKYGIMLYYKRDIINYIVEDRINVESDSGGAREVLSKLEAEFTTEVAKFINKKPNVTSIIAIQEGEGSYQNKNRLETDARIVIKEFRSN